MASKKTHLKQNLVPILVETSDYTKGFQAKLPQDELPPGSATGSSFNFFLDDDGKWTTRKGSKYFGTKSVDTGGCTSSGKLLRRDGVELPLVFYTTKSKYIHPDTGDWAILETGYTTGLIFGKAMGERSSDNVNYLIFGNGIDSYRVWSGITGSVASFDSSSVTLKGSTNLLDLGFLPVGKISDNGTIYTYGGILLAAQVNTVTTTSILIQGNVTLASLGFAASGNITVNGLTFAYSSLSSQTFVGVTPDPTQINAPSVTSFTNNTIVISGAVSLATLNFLASGSILINGTTFTYSGISGETFTGISPDPTANGVAIGNIISNTNLTSLSLVKQTGVSLKFVSVTPDPTLNGMANNDPIAQAPIVLSGLPLGNVMVSYSGRVVMFNKPIIALYGGGSIVGSKLNDYTTFVQSSPRVASEGYQLIMAEGGGNGTALVHFQDGIACFKQNAVSFHQVTYDQNDAPSIQPLLPYDDTISGHIGCVGPKLAFPLRDQVFFVSPRKIINTLQQVSQVNYPQSLPMSDRIKTLVSSMTWDANCCGIGFDSFARFCGKATSVDKSPDQQVIYDQRFDCWWTPFIGQSISSYFVYGGNLYGTLADSPDVIQLDVGFTDFATAIANGNQINASLTLERQNFGRKSARKKSRLLYVEGWMSKAGTATFTFQIDENGVSYTGTLSGNESGYFFDANTGGTFGEEAFGGETFGGTWDQNSILPDGVGHFRILFNFPPTSFWNIQMTIATSSYFKLINHSTDAQLTDVAIAGGLKKALG